jgi:predicted RNA polymerase sigma factor
MLERADGVINLKGVREATTGRLLVLAVRHRDVVYQPGGELVLLADQDRSRWNQELIVEGQGLVRV